MPDFNLIHKFELFGDIIVLDINSDSIHLIDEETGYYLDCLEETGIWEVADGKFSLKYPGTEAAEVREEIKELIDAGKLFSSEEEIREFKVPENPIVKAMCLHVAHDCQLRCLYCFADQGPYGGNPCLMDFEVGRKAFEFLFRESKNRVNLNVDYFGGEPLMNFDVVRELTLYAEKRAEEEGKIIEFTLTTNGVNLTEETCDFIAEHNIALILSADGRKKIQDKMRPTANGKGSYDISMPKFRRMEEKYPEHNTIFRGTFTRNNLDFTEDVRHLTELGFRHLSLEPVVSPPEKDYAIREEDIPVIEKEYEKLARFCLSELERGNNMDFFHFNIDLFASPCLPKRVSACGAGHEYVAVSPQGDLYPCHQFVGEEEYIVGSVDEGIWDRTRGKSFQEANVFAKKDCRGCWARFYCSGGCHANNIRYAGGLTEVYKIGCALQKKRMECGIWLNVRKQLQGL